MNQPHPHAASMLLYAQDAAETDTPWERWEYQPATSIDWEALSDHPSWHKCCGYRRKPRTILINGIEVPEPIKEEPKVGEKVFFLNLSSFTLFNVYSWAGDIYDKDWLNKGLLHFTEEAAIAHAKAMLVPSQRN